MFFGLCCDCFFFFLKFYYLCFLCLKYSCNDMSIRFENGHSLVIVIDMLQRFSVNQGQQDHSFPLIGECKNPSSEVRDVAVHDLEGATHLDYHQFHLHQDYENNFYSAFSVTGLSGGDAVPHVPSYLPSICPPPSAFLGPKCALWDCPRPAQGLDWCQDYCSSFHAALALNEGPPGMGPVLRPGGIGLKDALLFAALGAKAQGKDVGIPECEGAATAKSPWNAPGRFFIFGFPFLIR
jgi:hypothetical protein